MTKTTNLDDFKRKKKVQRVVKDLERIEHLLHLILKGMANYKRYKPVRSLLTNTMENKSLIALYLKKYKDVLKEME